MNLKQPLNFYHLNVRRENEGKKKTGPIAVDLSLQGQVPLEAIRGLMSSDHAFALVTRLYNEAGELATGDFTSHIDLIREGVGVHATLATEAGILPPLDFPSANFNKISLDLLAGRVVELKARLQVRGSEDDLPSISRLIGQDVLLDLAQKQSDLFAESGQATTNTSEAGSADLFAKPGATALDPLTERQLGELQEAGVVTRKDPFKTPEEISQIRDAVEREDELAARRRKALAAGEDPDETVAAVH